MANGDEPGQGNQWDEQPVDWRAIGAQFTLGAEAAGKSLQNATYIQKTAINIITWTLAWALKIASYAGAFLAERIADAEDQNKDGFNRIAAVAIKDMFGVDVSGSFSTARGRGGNIAAADAIGDAMLKAFSGEARGAVVEGELQPSDLPAKHFLSAMAQLALEGWLEGWMVEALSLGQIETFGDLDDTISHVLGLGRASAAVHGPLVNHLIVTPLEWKINKQHRPNMLSESEIIKAFQRGDYSGDEAAEELARLGYSDRRQDMLLKSAARKLSLEDLLQLWRHGEFPSEFVEASLHDQGYDQATARLAMRAANSRRTDAQYDNSLAALKRAFVNRDLDEAPLVAFLAEIILDEFERNAWLTAARTERELNGRRLSHSEVIDCVELEILPVAYYRGWLELEGYSEPDGFALELRLRARLDQQTALEDQRARLAAERAAEKTARTQAAAARLADVEADRALHRRGSLADLNRAAVRGLIPIARVAEVLAPQYDADTVQTMIALVESDRAAYLEQQQAAADARKRAGVRNIDVGTIEAAVLAGVLTLAEFDVRLSQLGFPAGDRAVLAGVLAARQKDLRDAQAARRQAEILSRSRAIDLGRLEQLVRRGARTLAQYAAQLTALGFDDGARAGMIELLKLKIADDEQAAAIRRAAGAAADVRGVSLEQLRRAVIRGVASVDAFQRLLVEQRYTSDAQAVLLAELRDELATADEARRRRAAPPQGADSPELSLDRLARAVRLGIVTPAAYEDRLIRAGYSDDDIAIELELLHVEIADTQAARAAAGAAGQAGADRALSLEQLARAVKAGAATLEDYRARAAALGYSAGDVELLARVLADELETAADAAARRVTIGGELAARTLNIGDLERAVKAGELTIGAYVDQLIAWGYGADDAELLAGLLGADKTGGE